MTTFTLDDVRDSFSRDVTRFLTEVEGGAGELRKAGESLSRAHQRLGPQVERMVVGFHGIAGSASLIGLGSLQHPSKRLEDLALQVAEANRIIGEQLARLRTIVEASDIGVRDLFVIAKHELASEGPAAASASEQLMTSLDRARKELDAPRAAASLDRTPAKGMPSIPMIPKPAPKPVAPPTDELDLAWADEPAPSPAAPVTAAPKPALAPPPQPQPAAPPSQPDAPDPELAEVFRAEALETIVSLEGHWAQLDGPNAHVMVEPSLRLLHLLKGAAASVGLSNVSAAAHALHVGVESWHAAGMPSELVPALREEFEQLTRQTLPDRAAPATAPRTPASIAVGRAPMEDDDPRLLFLEEAKVGLAELRALVAQAQGAQGTARGVAIARAERVLHRLKGSALIVGENAIGATVASAQDLCEAGEDIDLGAFERHVLELASALEAATPPPELVETRFAFKAPPAEEWEVYLEESTTLLEDLDQQLRKLETAAQPKLEVATLFRLYHTLKGASNAVGLVPIGRLLHVIETFLEQAISDPDHSYLRALIVVLADQHRDIRANIGRARKGADLEVDVLRCTDRLRKLREQGAPGMSWLPANDPAWGSAIGESAAIDRHASSPSHGSSVEHASAASDGSQRDADDAAPGGERRFVRVAADRLDFLLDQVGELVIARSRILARIRRVGNMHDDTRDRHGAVVRMIDTFASSTQFTNLDGSHGRTMAPRARLGRVAATGQAAGFGALEMDQYEEIHILSRQLEEAANDINEIRRGVAQELSGLTDDAESLGAVVGELQAEITRARMLTVEALFGRLHLPTREAAERYQKNVDIVIQDDGVAIDKSVSDALFAPLLHVVRNAVVHGLETPDERAAAGKPRMGQVRLSARQAQGQIVLELADDGRGVDRAKLKAKGVAKGLVPASIAEDDPAVLDLMFVHGVSTAAKVDDVAGRGVGGNIIRRAIERLSGTIEVDSRPGQGTTFRIALPLSMSITQAVILRTGAITLAVPIALAEAIVSRDDVVANESFGRARVKYREHLMPLFNACEIFGATVGTSQRVVVICAVGAGRVAIEAEAVVGQEEVVVKGLGHMLDGHPLLAGSSQRGDGELIVMLDVPGILASTQAPEAARRAMPRPAQPLSDAHPSREASDADDATATAASTTASNTGSEATTSDAPAHPALAAEPVPAVPPTKIRALFVDDSLSVRKVGERMLAGLGVEVVTAVDGLDALEKLRTMAFSIVFTDLEMPRMHGFGLIQEMQYVPAYRAIPVVVVSSRSGKKHVDQAKGMGAREYLTKPFTPEILHEIIARLVSRVGLPS